MTRDEALQVLGLKQGASPREVRLAYRELAQMLHPDKFNDNKKLRARAEQQMRSINEARDVLLKGVSATSSHADGAASRRTRTSGASASTPAEIAFEAEARAHAAETARLTVVAQARTLRERRGGMVGMIAVAALVLIVTWRMSGLVGSVVDKVLAANPKSIQDFKAGKEKAFGFLVGQVMRELKGQASPQVVNQALREKLEQL